MHRSGTITDVKWAVLAGSLVVTTVATLYAYAATERERTYRQLIDTGDAALARDDGYAAIAAFSGAIALKGESMLGYLKRGEAYARRAEYETAVPDLSRAAELDPTAPRAQELLGDVNYGLHRYDRAAQRYEEFLRLDEGAPRILYKLALSHYAADRPAAALSALKKAIALESKFAEAHYLLGLCLRDMQDVRGAVASLERAVLLGPALLQAREELAELYAQQGRQRDRIKQLDALLALDARPSREVALGLAYAEAGRVDNAILKLGDATERYPDHAYTYVALGRVWLQTAQRDRVAASRRVSLTKALAALEGAVAMDASSEAMTLLGRALLMSGDDEQAERVLHEATEKLPVEPSSFFYLAEAAERRGRFDVARLALLDYHALDLERDGRRLGELAERIADTSMRLNDPPTAVRWYQRALDAAGPDDALLTRLAEAQLRAGDVANARTTIDRVLEKDPANAAARLLLRRLY